MNFNRTADEADYYYEKLPVLIKILKSTRLIKKFPEMKNFKFCRPTTYYITDSRPYKGMKEEGGLDIPD